MKVLGKDIGTALDKRYAEVEHRVLTEALRGLVVEGFEGGSISNVDWQDSQIRILVHTGVPRHALAHVFGVALEHLRQRLDRFPDVVRPPVEDQPEGAEIVRQALRELVLAPEAELHLAPLNLDDRWEVEQRHQGMKDLLRDPPEDWNEPGVIGNDFMALQYARFAIQHPKDMWDGLRRTMEQRLPLACERGTAAVKVVRTYGWGGPGACLESLVGVRNELELQDVAAIEDRRTRELM
ncbi:MAG: hypothetical protein IT299_10470 [Dehalococcoidia bacterium]|nr:hypothetical protein [Dehalococcoidia bacterium]